MCYDTKTVTECGIPPRISRELRLGAGGERSMAKILIVVDNQEEIMFRYEPSSFKKGKWITLLTLLLLLIYGIWIFKKKKTHEKI